jgi:hypothetical protein
MAAGNDTFGTHGVPLFPATGSTMKQQTASTAVDILTIQAAASGTGDFLVLRNSSETELFVINSAGAITTAPSMTFPGAAGTAGVVLEKTGTGQTTFARLRLPILNTAPASAGLTKGDLWLSKATTDVYRLSLCISTAAGTPRYGARFIRTTIGSASS